MANNRQRRNRRRNGGTGPRGGGKKGAGGRSYLERRQREQERVTEPMTPKDVRRETRSSTQLKFRPLERAIGGEIRASKKRTGEVGDWWNNYIQEVSQGRGEIQAAYDAAGAASLGQMAQASAIDSANTQQLNTDEAASAALRGVAPSTAPAQRESAAQAQRNYLATAQAGTNRTLGANQFAYQTDQRRIGVGQSIASRKQEQARTRDKEHDRKLTRQERGAYAAEKRGELREKEREYQIERGAFGLDKKEFGEQKRTNRAAEKQAKADAKADAAKDAYDRKIEGKELNFREQELAQEWQRLKEGKKGGRSGPSPEERRENRSEMNNAFSAASSLYNAAGAPSYSNAQWNQFITLVAEEGGVSYTAAKRAVSKLRRRSGGGRQYGKGGTGGWQPGVNASPKGR